MEYEYVSFYEEDLYSYGVLDGYDNFDNDEYNEYDEYDGYDDYGDYDPYSDKDNSDSEPDEEKAQSDGDPNVKSDGDDPTILNHDETIDYLTNGLPLTLAIEIAGVLDYVRSMAANKSIAVVAWTAFVYQIESWMLDPQYKRVLKNYVNHNSTLNEGENFEGVYYTFESIYNGTTRLNTMIWTYYNNADDKYLGTVIH